MTEGIIGAIIGAIITGLFTFAIARYKIHKQNEKENLLKNNADRKAAFDNRPEMQIIEFYDYTTRIGYGLKKKTNMEIYMAHIENVTVSGRVMAYYDEVNLDKSQWVCVIYLFKNVGKTDIKVLNVIGTHKRDTVIFSCENDRHEIYFNNNMLNYSVNYDTKIRVGETFTLKVCYNKERIIVGTLSSMLALGFGDIYGNYWQQPLFAPYNKIYDSYRITCEEYRQDLLIDDAIECFKDPYLW